MFTVGSTRSVKFRFCVATRGREVIKLHSKSSLVSDLISKRLSGSPASSSWFPKRFKSRSDIMLDISDGRAFNLLCCKFNSVSAVNAPSVKFYIKKQTLRGQRMNMNFVVNVHKEEGNTSNKLLSSRRTCNFWREVNELGKVFNLLFINWMTTRFVNFPMAAGSFFNSFLQQQSKHKSSKRNESTFVSQMIEEKKSWKRWDLIYLLKWISLTPILYARSISLETILSVHT